MTKRIIKNRIPVIIFCEGESERSYVKFLGAMANEAGLHYAFNNQLCGNTGGGDILRLAQGAEKKLDRLSNRGSVPEHRFLLLDTDINELEPVRCTAGIALANELGIDIIWQEKNHEGFLLRHFKGYGSHNNNESEVNTRIVKNIPSYKKPVDANFLAKKLSVENVRYARNHIESFDGFFNKIGWEL